MKHIESQHQCAFFTWLDFKSCQHPALKFVFAIPNGGARNKITGAILKREGVKRGVPDIFVPIPRNGKHGLFVEMKSEKGRISIEQNEYRMFLENQGYQVEISWSFDQAKTVLEKYMNIEFED